MKFAELTEIGWGIWKDTEGNKWVATEEDELMNIETGEIEKIKEDYEMKKLERWEIARGKELVEYIENSESYDMCEEEVKELITLAGLEQEWEEKQDEFEEVLWKAMDIVKGGEDKMLAEILIFSGEGETGTWKEYKGKDSDRAIKLRLTKERCNGDRWAKAYRHIGDEVYQNIYNTNDMREVPREYIRG